MSKNPTVYLRDEEYGHLESNFESVSGGIRSLVQDDMAAEEAEEAPADD